MRHLHQKHHNLIKKSQQGLFLLLVFLLSMQAHSASSKFGYACKFSVAKSDSKLEDLDQNHLVEKDTGQRFELVLPKNNLEKRMSTEQECGTCYIESAYNSVENLVEQAYGGQISVDRVHMLANVFQTRVYNRIYGVDTGNSAGRITTSFEYLEKWSEKEKDLDNYESWSALEETYDFISAGKVGDIFQKVKKQNQELREVDFISVPRKSLEDIKFEDTQISLMNLELVAGVKAILDSNIDVLKSKVNATREELYEKLDNYRINSMIFKEVERASTGSKTTRLPELKGVNNSLRKLMNKIYEQITEERELSVPDDLLAWIKFREEFDHLNSIRKSELLADEWVRVVFDNSMKLENVLLKLDENRATRVLSVYESVTAKFKKEAEKYWRSKPQQTPILTGLKTLRVNFSSEPVKAPTRLLSTKQKLQKRLEKIEEALVAGVSVILSYDYFYPNIYKPTESGAEFRLLDKENPNHPKVKKAITGEPYHRGGGHADVVINVLRNSEGDITHLVLQGSHGSDSIWNGKYLMSADYFLNHVHVVDYIEYVELGELPSLFDER